MAISIPDDVRRQIRLAIQRTVFPKKSKESEDIIVGVIKTVKLYQNNRYHSYQGKKVTRVSFGTDRPKGPPDEAPLRNLIISSLFRSWLLAFEKSPRINNKGYPCTKFVNFAEDIFRILGIGKVEDHLEEFRSFRKASLKHITVKK